MRRSHWIGFAVLLVLTLMVLSRDVRVLAQQAGAGGNNAGDTNGNGVAEGDNVTVYLRGDASGTVFNDRIPSTGNLVSRTGKVVSDWESWLVIEVAGDRHCIPHDSIALVEVAGKK